MSKPIEVMRVGVHPSQSGKVFEFKASDLATSARIYDPAKRAANLTINHPTDDQPKLGSVLAAFVDGDRLKVLPKDVLAEFSQRVNGGELNRVSACFYPPSHKDNPAGDEGYYLKHVGFLTADKTPAVDLNTAAFSAPEDGLIYFESPIGAKADPVDTSDLDRREAEVSRREAQIREAEVASFIAGLVEQGRVLPVDAEPLVSFIAGIPDDGTISFAQGEHSTADWLRGWLSRLPKSVEFGRIAKPETVVAFDKKDPREMAKMANEYIAAEKAQGRKVSASEAMNYLTRGK